MDVYTLPPTKAEAIASGFNRYHSGIPCSRGHKAPRKLSGHCTVCVRLTSNRRRSDPEGAARHRAANRKWRESELGKAARVRGNLQRLLDGGAHHKRRRKAMPRWADRRAIYEFASLRPRGHHLDHIVPINGATVCGLHVLENLQIIPAKANYMKGNKVIPITLTAAICPIHEFNFGQHQVSVAERPLPR